MTSRITPYEEGGSIDERIDEIVQTGVDVHFEALDESFAALCRKSTKPPKPKERTVT